jgi:hypothetical protein
MRPSLPLATVVLNAGVSSHAKGKTAERLAWAQSNPEDRENTSADLGNNHKGKYATEVLVSAGYGIYPVSKTIASNLSIGSLVTGEDRQTLSRPPFGRK